MMSLGRGQGSVGRLWHALLCILGRHSSALELWLVKHYRGKQIKKEAAFFQEKRQIKQSPGLGRSPGCCGQQQLRSKQSRIQGSINDSIGSVLALTLIKLCSR